MKTALFITTFAMLLTACALNTSDTSIRRHLVGTWSSDSNPGKVIENKADGTFVVKMNGAESGRGKWTVSNGYVISGPEDERIPFNPALSESNKVVSISEDTAVLLGIDRQTPLTFHKQ